MRDGTHTALGEAECIQNFVGEDQQARHLVTTDIRLAENIEMYGFIWRQLAGCFKHANETSGSIKASEQCKF